MIGREALRVVDYVDLNMWYVPLWILGPWHRGVRKGSLRDLSRCKPRVCKPSWHPCQAQSDICCRELTVRSSSLCSWSTPWIQAQQLAGIVPPALGQSFVEDPVREEPAKMAQATYLSFHSQQQKHVCLGCAAAMPPQTSPPENLGTHTNCRLYLEQGAPGTTTRCLSRCGFVCLFVYCYDHCTAYSRYDEIPMNVLWDLVPSGENKRTTCQTKVNSLY